MTRLPRSIARLKIALGCPCAVTALPVGPDEQLQQEQEQDRAEEQCSAEPGDPSPVAHDHSHRPERNMSPGSTDAIHSNAIDTTSRATRKAESGEFFVTLGSQANAAMGRLSAALVLFGGAIASAAARPEARSAEAGRALPAVRRAEKRTGDAAAV